MKLLYLSCHPTLEYEELIIFDQLGIETFSTGFYRRNGDSSPSRPALEFANHINVADEFEFYHPGYKTATRLNLNREFAKKFDVVMVSQMPQLLQNWNVIKDKKVIWRTCGLSNTAEQSAQVLKNEGLIIVRWSPTEKKIPNYAGESCLIRASIDSNQFSEWSVTGNNALIVSGALRGRGIFTNYSVFSRIHQEVKLRIIGGGNEDIPGAETVDYFDLIKLYQTTPVFLSLGTKPSPYVFTLVEAMMVGCPIVTIGPHLGNLSTDKTYEGHILVDNGIDGIVADNHDDLIMGLNNLINNRSLGHEYSVRIREKAKQLFSREVAIPKWNEFFKNLGVL